MSLPAALSLLAPSPAAAQTPGPEYQDDVQAQMAGARSSVLGLTFQRTVSPPPPYPSGQQHCSRSTATSRAKLHRLHYPPCFDLAMALGMVQGAAQSSGHQPESNQDGQPVHQQLLSLAATFGM
jgi:hypothetical protein